MARSPAEKPPMADYREPTPGFAACRLCGCPVAIAQDGEALTPVLGNIHLCGENCACQWAGPRTTVHHEGTQRTTTQPEETPA